MITETADKPGNFILSHPSIILGLPNELFVDLKAASIKSVAFEGPRIVLEFVNANLKLVIKLYDCFEKV